MSGRPPRNYMNRGKSSQFTPFVAQLPFDLSLFDPAFAAPVDDHLFTELLVQHYNKLIPPTNDQQTLSNLVNRVTEILETLVVNPTDFTAGQLEEVRSVGSFKLGTWMANHNVADMVVVFRTLPTVEAVADLHTVVKARLKDKSCTVTEHPYGFSVTLKTFTVRVMVTTVLSNLKNLDSNIHVDPALQKTTLAAIRQTRWLEDNASHTNIKVTTRLIKDFVQRFTGFKHLNNWIINLLAYFVVLQNPGHQALPVNQAFRRWLQLLAAGMLLPGSAGVLDPCEPGNVRLHTAMSLLEQDEVCCTAQTLLRVLEHGAYKALFSHNDDDPSCSRSGFLKAVQKECGVRIEWSEAVIFLDQDSVAPMEVEQVAA